MPKADPQGVSIVSQNSLNQIRFVLIRDNETPTNKQSWLGMLGRVDEPI